MRASQFSVAVIAALGMTVWAPSPADAQVIVYPQINTSPYVYSSYWNPGYSYAYRWGNPYYNRLSYGWSNPFSYGNYSWYYRSPYYTNYYRGMGWPRYAWGGGHRRW